MGNDSETVTVLMPVYNAGPYVAAAIESILKQTWRDFGFLIIDDGSTDGSAATIERFAKQDARIRVIHAAHEGVAAALNRGLAVARGAIIVRMDADDVSWPERIARQMAFLADHPDIAVLGSAFRSVDRRGRPIRDCRYPTEPAEVEAGFLQGAPLLAHPTVAFRRDVIRRLGGYRAAFDRAEDFDLWLRVSECHRMANLPDILVDLRNHGENVSTRRRREQALAAHVARLAAFERRARRPDPTATLDRLNLADLDRFEMAPGWRPGILIDLSEAALTSFEATREARYLADAEESLALLGRAASARDRRAVRRLAAHLWAVGERRRSLAALSMLARSKATKLRQAAEIVSAAPARRLIAEWLVHCADPLGPRRDPPRRTLSPVEAMELIRQADVHGVLPAVVRHFPPFTREQPAFARVRADAQARQRLVTHHTVMLRHEAEAVMAAAAGLPVAVIKGPSFARLLYPAPALRPYTDIDLLVSPRAVSRLSDVLAEQGFELGEGAEPDAKETKWVHRDNQALMVEVQTDLVHAPSLAAALSLTYDDIAGMAETPAVQLVVAALHAALGGHFDKLRNIVDICQAARLLDGASEERRFLHLVEHSGARLAVKTGLGLAGDLFDEPRCHALAREVPPARRAGLARRLISRSVVTSTATPERALHSWRRSAFRELLKQSDALQRPGGKVCLVIIFNHAYPANIEKLRSIYRARFSQIVFLLPNTRVPDDPTCFTGYRGSYCFHGLVADARDFLLAQGADIFVFAADDALLNPKFDESTIADALHLRRHDAFVASFEFLAGERYRERDDPAAPPATEWCWIPRIASRLDSPNRLFGSGVEGHLGELPDRKIAIEKFERYGTPSLRLDVEDGPKLGLKETYSLPMPLAYGLSDVFAIRADRFERFAHYLGVFASLDLFAEVAVPTALILAAESVVSAKDVGQEFYWGVGPATPLASVDDLAWWFPTKQLFVHPIKLSSVRG